MNLFERLMVALCAEGETPTTFGWVHLVSFLIFIGTTAAICYYLKDADDKKHRSFLKICWVVLFVFELYRQLVFAFDYSDGVASWDYAWYQFPFQICSAPLYTLLPIAFLKDGRVRHAIMAYMATFSMFGGLAVMVYPSDIFCVYIGINIQSLIHHGLQAAIGILTLLRLKDKLNHKTLLSALSVFGTALAIAMTLNLSVHAVLVANGLDDTFNMFFISPYHSCSLPILSAIRDAAPYPVFLMTYVFGFGAVASIMLYGGRYIIELVNKTIEKTKSARKKTATDAE